MLEEKEIRTKQKISKTFIDTKVGIIILVFFSLAVGFVFLGIFFLIGNSNGNPAVLLRPVCRIYSASEISNDISGVSAERAIWDYNHGVCQKNISQYSGKLNILVQDNFLDKISKEKYYLETDSGDKQLLFANRPYRVLKSGERINVAGYEVGENSILFDASKNFSDSSTLTGFNLDNRALLTSENSQATGTKKTLMVLNYFQDNIEPAESTLQIAQETMRLVNIFYKENSFNKINFTGVDDADQEADVRGWYKLDSSMPSCTNFDATQYYTDVVNSLYNQIDFPKYDGGFIILAAPFGCNKYWLGLAWLSPRTVNIPGAGNISVSISIINSNNFPGGGYFNHPPDIGEINNSFYDAKDKIVEVISHELGHNFGLQHASFTPCNFMETPLHLCSIDEYEDGYEAMGNWGAHNFDAKHKAELGWIAPIDGTLAEVSEDGTYNIYPIQYAQTNRIQALKIPRIDNEYMWAEYRGIKNNSSFDYEMAHWSRPYLGNIYNGLLLHIDDPIKDRSILFLKDGLPGAHPSNPALEVGESFTDPLTGTTIDVLSMHPNVESPSDSYITVRVKFNSPKDCPNGLQPRECTGTGDANFCFNGELIPTDCRGCGCESGLTCGMDSSGGYKCCASVNSDGKCVACYSNQDCSDNNNCTVDICENPGLATSQCQHEPVADSCGDRECGQSPDGCYNCGSCVEGSGCLDGQCSTGNCSDHGGVCVSRMIGCGGNDPATSKYTAISGLDYYCPPGRECCVPPTENID